MPRFVHSGLASGRRPAITWTNDDQHKEIYTRSDVNGFTGNDDLYWTR